MVQTPNGLKAIETFKPGDLVYSKDQFTQAPGVRPVVGTKQTLDQLLYEVVVKNAQGQTETYTTTSEHPFWITNGPANGQWLKASLLQAGLHLTNAQGETLEVVSQTALEQTATVYNIEVHEHSTYHVGEMGVWVHNATCCNVGVITEINVGNGKLIGSTENLTSTEKKFIDEMVMGGRKVEIIPATNAGRSADFFIDDIKYELNTMMNVTNPTSDKLSAALSSTIMNARGQSGNIIVDARNQAGMTAEIAERGIIRALSRDTASGSKIQGVTIITPQGTIFIPRKN